MVTPIFKISCSMFFLKCAPALFPPLLGLLGQIPAHVLDQETGDQRVGNVGELSMPRITPQLRPERNVRKQKQQ